MKVKTMDVDTAPLLPNLQAESSTDDDTGAMGTSPPLVWVLDDAGQLTQESGSDEQPDTPGLSSWKVALNLCKCTVGAGSFSLPYAFKNGGLWASSLGTVLLGGLAAYTYCILADAEKFQLKQQKLRRRMTYPETARACLPTWTLGGVNLAELYVYFNIVLTAAGACMAYVVFISTTMPDVIPGAQPYQIILCLIPICAPLVLLRTFHILAFTSILGDVAVLAGVTATVVFGATHNDVHENLPAIDGAGLGPAMSAIAFLFLSHIVTLPMAQSLHDDLKRPRAFHKVVWTSYVFITFANLAFAAMCYLLFGPATEDNIIKNLSTGAVLQAVRVLLCLDLLFTIPMLLAAGREILEESLMKTRFGRFGEHTRNVFRMLLLLIILGVTFGVVSADSSQAFGNVVTLVGAVACFSCGFIMPPLMHLANHGWLRAGILSFVFHLSITALGLLGMVTGVYFTVSSM